MAPVAFIRRSTALTAAALAGVSACLPALGQNKPALNLAMIGEPPTLDIILGHGRFKDRSRSDLVLPRLT